MLANSVLAKLRSGGSFRRFASWLRALPLPAVRRYPAAVAGTMANGELSIVVLLALPWTLLSGFALAAVARSKSS